MNCEEKEFQVGETIEPVLERVGDWPCKVESVQTLGHGSLDVTTTLPYIDMEFIATVAMDGETLIRDPRPRKVVWYEVVGLHDGSERSRVLLAREQALRYFAVLDGAELRTYHNAECVKVEAETDLLEEIAAAN